MYVKRFVVIGHRGQSGCMAWLDREDVEPIVVNRPPEEVLVIGTARAYFLVLILIAISQ